ncbi:MAG TPA: UPF0182 family protein [Dehalococcoidia bacterium]|nr:UPF0182 family protein [Dehalococcoidia bacterium]
MHYDLTSDADGTPKPPLPGISARDLRRVIKWSLPTLGVLLLFLMLWWAVDFYTNWLWFNQLGFTGVLIQIAWFKSSLFIIGSAVTAIILAINFGLVLKFSRGPSVLPVPPETMRLMVALVGAGAVLTLLITSSIFGSTAAQHWEAFLLWFHREEFNIVDPAFGHDLSFYIVTLPVLNFIQGWLLGLIITATVASLALYVAVFGLRGMNLVISPRMLNHLATLGVALMLIIAFGHQLDLYHLVLSGRGIVYGATYTDINARVPVLWFLTIIALLSAGGIAISPYYRGLRLMAGAFSLWIILALTLGVAFPLLFQRIQVSPNEFSREEPFITDNIEATRAAYQLDQVQERDYPSDGVLKGEWTRTAGEENQATLDNIRLWDLPPLLDAYNQLQFMELYYNFRNIDSDRYTVFDQNTGEGRLRQVLVAARELDSENLPADAQNWVNQRLQYTHGYGITMSPANEFTPGEGRPKFSIPGIPLQSPPEIYYGESPIDYAIVNTNLSEVNPNSVVTSYAGSGGVPLSSTLRRIAYAWQMGDINILLSEHITRDSRIQYRRQVRDRVQTIAPFLKLDQDPYPVLDTQGKLWWLLDAYTTSSRYPYSTPSSEGFNYIRNSVKVSIDAYNGTVALYVIDPDDRLIQMYQRAFPGLFQAISAMPADLREHVRYPVGLFSTQAQLYLRYHVIDPQEFFNQADQWALPTETRIGKTGVAVTPAYLVLNLPDQTSKESLQESVQESVQEFILLLPLSPAGEKKNLVAWLAARNDGPHYGELLSFKLPGDRQFDGPSQVEARIENDQSVSQQFTLWDGAGSQIIRGQLLAIPLADTILYVEPLYLQSSGLAFPELKKVILATNSNLVMADTLDEGIELLLQEESAPAPTPDTANTGGPILSELDRTELEAELDQFKLEADRLQESLNRLRESLENLREALEGVTP